MILLTTAMPMEAKPLVLQLGLSAVPEETFPVYRNEAIILVVTGVGNLNASAATGWAMGRFQGIDTAINAGFCGAAPEIAGLHEWVYISSIRDKATGRLSLPDILQQHPFMEQALLTVPTVVKDCIDWNGVIDMEGSGFFETARKFLSPDRISLLKWVSDPLTGSIDPEEIATTYKNAINPAVAFIRKWPLSMATDLEEVPDELFNEVDKRLKLTATQRHFARKWSRGYLSRGGDPEEVFNLLPKAAPTSKVENTRFFEDLKYVFKN